MTSVLSADKRLETKRAVRRMAKTLRASLRSSQRSGNGQECRKILEKLQTDDISITCAKQLLLMRLEFKEMLRGACSSEYPVEELMSSTGLERESVVAILQKHGYFDGKRSSPESTSLEKEHENISPEEATTQFKEGNVTFVVPKLDMSEVRNDIRSPEGESPRSARVSLEELPPSFEVRQVRHITPKHHVVEEATTFFGNSPREVTDSSAEISDLAKRLGARLYQDASLVDQLRNVNREKSFVEQLRNIVATSTTLSTVQLRFIPSIPIAKPTQSTTICKEVDVQTSVCAAEWPISSKEMRDNATDVPSLDYVSSTELRGFQQLPQTIATQEDVSSSAFSSDQSAGQVVESFTSRARTTISFDRDGSALFNPSKTVRVSELVEDSLLSGLEPQSSSIKNSAISTPSRPKCNASPRTPRISESPWRPSSRRLHLEEMDISTSQENSSLEVVSIRTPKLFRYNQAESNPPSKKDEGVSNGVVENENSSKSTDSSHQDEEHTYNQVSQIASE